MTTIDAIYRNGAFQPIDRVELPDNCHVRLQIESLEPTPQQAKAVEEIYRIMSLRFHSGQHDVAERHNEHQP